MGNDSPLVGILTLPCNQDPNDCSGLNLTLPFEPISYVPASYVKFLESGGARVIPLLSDMSDDMITSVMSQLNGILFTGGVASFSNNNNNGTINWYWTQVTRIMEYLRKNKDIPLWGTCLGMEAMICATAMNGTSVMNLNLTANYMALALNFTSYAANNESRMLPSHLNAYTAYIYDTLSTENVTFNEHFYGFNPSVFVSDPYVRTNFTVLSYSSNPILEDIQGSF
ncbi:peptidase C26 family protein, partial [Reticulomyxa filosa]